MHNIQSDDWDYNLSSCFLVACGAINLPSKEESLYALCLKGGIQLTRVYAVILNTIMLTLALLT